MEKWLRENREVGLNKALQGLGFTLTLSLLCPFPTHSFLLISWQSPLSLLGPARTPPHSPPPSLAPLHQSACQPGCRLCSLRPGLLLEKRQVCLLQSPLRNLNNQWPTTLPALRHRSSPPRAGSLVAGRQVEGTWGRLGAQLCPRAEVQGKLGSSPPGAGPQQEWEYQVGGAAQLQGRSDWYSHSLSLLKDQSKSYPSSLVCGPRLQGSLDSQSCALSWSPSVRKGVLFFCPLRTEPDKISLICSSKD